VSNPVIQVEHLTRRFGELTALDDVSFQVRQGEVVGILGVNGAGKSTAMRILTGYLPATSGAALVAGFDVLRQSLEVRKRIGYLPESVPLYREHRVREMLEFQARLHRVPRRERRARIDAVLQRVGLGDRKRQLIGTLSRGLRQRVGLAVALLPEPEVLILDEPTSGLDPLQRIEVRTLVRELAEKHTVLLSSHILPEIEAVCPRVIILHKGRVAADGQRSELVRGRAGDHVHVEAVVGADVEAAARLLRTLPGVTDVALGARLGIHQAFEVFGNGDLREDVGALAASRGWALRELSRREPTLEELFARIALGEGDVSAWSAKGPPPAAPAPAGPTSERVELTLPPPRALDAAGAHEAAPPPRKAAYNLNPFEKSNRPPPRTPSADSSAGTQPGSAGEACP
jgi:ABC-2 type transport system ATP-binding protein